MDDLISRQAAIDAVGINTWAGQRLLKVPSAQPEITAEQVNEFCKERGWVVLTKEEYHWLKSLKSKAEEYRWNGGGNY